MHFVGSLRPSDHPELLSVRLGRYAIVDEEAFPGLVAFEARTEALGALRRTIITHSDRTY
jgi:hypothetical protein